MYKFMRLYIFWNVSFAFVIGAIHVHQGMDFQEWFMSGLLLFNIILFGIASALLPFIWPLLAVLGFARLERTTTTSKQKSKPNNYNTHCIHCVNPNQHSTKHFTRHQSMQHMQYINAPINLDFMRR